MNPKLKNVVIITIAILPFGLVALGAWKAYELLKKGKQDEPNKTE